MVSEGNASPDNASRAGQAVICVVGVLPQITARSAVLALWAMLDSTSKGVEWGTAQQASGNQAQYQQPRRYGKTDKHSPTSDL